MRMRVGGLLAALVLGLATGARAEEAAGDWTGVLKTAQYGDVTMALHLKKDGAAYAGVWDDVTLGFPNLRVTNVAVSADHIAMAIPAAQATYEATWDPAAHQWAGVWKSPGAEAGLPLRFSRGLPPPAPEVAGQAQAQPALWVVKGHGSTVYLFETVHFVNPTQAWRTLAIDRAFKESGELWLEIPLPVTAKGSSQAFPPEGAQRIAQLYESLGTTTDGPTLSSRLTPAEFAHLSSSVPVPRERLERMRPWMAAGLVQAGFLMKLGLSPAAGVDFALAEQAATDGKPVKSFETIEEQLHFFADLTPDEEMGYLRQMLTNAADGRAVVEATERAWLAGDDAALTELVVGRLKSRSPLFYRRFDVDRNLRWIPQIEAMLKNPGVRFVAVGAGHMLGPDGVPALLRKDGWRVERVR